MTRSAPALRDASIVTMTTSDSDAEATVPADAGPRAYVDSGTDRTPPTGSMNHDPEGSSPGPCSRDELQQHADAYLQAMASGDTRALKLHPSLRYTENGQDQQLGLGVWLQQPAVQFARHVLDPARCTSVTEAVLGPPLTRIVFGVRLRYVDSQLIESEAQVIGQNPLYFNPDAIVPNMSDPWLEPIAPSSRMSEPALIQIASNYFNSTGDSSLLPPSTPACLVRQNGALVGTDGSCAQALPAGPFDQIRFVAIDLVTGIAATASRHAGMIGFGLVRAHADLLDNVEFVGGTYSQTTGW